jgi:hypothetical protein
VHRPLWGESSGPRAAALGASLGSAPGNRLPACSGCWHAASIPEPPSRSLRWRSEALRMCGDYSGPGIAATVSLHTCSKQERIRAPSRCSSAMQNSNTRPSTSITPYSESKTRFETHDGPRSPQTPPAPNVSQDLAFGIMQRPADIRRQITSFSDSFLPRIRT